MAKVTLAEFPNALSSLIGEYSKEVIQKANSGVEEYTKILSVAMTQATTVHDTGDMERGWTYKMEKSGLFHKGIIYNELRGSIIHFHEFGTTHMEASPYVISTFDMLAPKLVSFLANKIK